MPASACAGRVTINLARAALRAGRGNVEGFLRNCDEVVATAIEVHRTRREVLANVAAAPGGALSPLFRGRGGREPLLSLSRATWSVGVSGLNEALLALTGFEFHEGDEHVVRTAHRTLSYLALRVRATGLEADLPVTLDADEDPAVAKRFFDADVRAEPERVTSALPGPGYTPGICVRRDAPVDVLLRLDREEPLHAHLATATLRLPIATKAAGGPDGVLALLAKCLRAGRAHQAEVHAW
jgi:anaerobic ribonucleoside-triphosphate reductase